MGQLNIKAKNTGLNIQLINHYKLYAKQIFTHVLNCVIPMQYPNLKDSHMIVELNFINDKKMISINNKYRNINNTTNVIAMQFLSNQELSLNKFKEVFLGETYISMPQLYYEAEKYKISVEIHLARLLIHGFLHLFGYDHDNETKALEMLILENTILEQMHINTDSLVSDYWYDA